jgi:hypothetical protein
MKGKNKKPVQVNERAILISCRGRDPRLNDAVGQGTSTRQLAEIQSLSAGKGRFGGRPDHPDFHRDSSILRLSCDPHSGTRGGAAER